jgi:hypothetical protein
VPWLEAAKRAFAIVRHPRLKREESFVPDLEKLLAIYALER